MRIVLATVRMPFVHGGAEALVQGLQSALRQAGHEVDTFSMTLHDHPARSVERCMRSWLELDLRELEGIPVDLVICLKFPSYYLQHPRKVVWLLHQHREVYDLWGTGGRLPRDRADWSLRRTIRGLDRIALSRAARVFTTSKGVSARLLHFNRVHATPVYHPPPEADRFVGGVPGSFILVPGRIEAHKRQHLFIEALARCRHPVEAVLTGRGGGEGALRAQITALGLVDRLRFLGTVSREELLDLYRRCLAVFYGPLEEDYGYVTLEAMLAAKPVVTCTDSGGPLEFVIDGQTGYAMPPDAGSVARALDRLYADRSLAAVLGREGRAHYDRLGLSWQRTVRTLLS